MTARPARDVRVRHLASRFFTSLRARPLDAATIASVAAVLEPAELRVWQGLPLVDQAESAAVCDRLRTALAGTAEAGDARWLAAALLHDAGKQCSGYGTVGRAFATVVAAAAGDARLRSWAARPASMRARVGRYALHDELGADLLRDAGARVEVVAWAGAHHRPERWPATGIPSPVCRALAAADGEPVPEPRGRNRTGR